MNFVAVLKGLVLSTCDGGTHNVYEQITTLETVNVFFLLYGSHLDLLFTGKYRSATIKISLKCLTANGKW